MMRTRAWLSLPGRDKLFNPPDFLDLLCQERLGVVDIVNIELEKPGQLHSMRRAELHA